MPWSGGAYSRVLDWTDDRAAGVNPQASRFDTDADDMAAGITACLHAGGQNAASADISWGTNKITNLGTPTADADAATKGYVDAVGTTGDIKFNFFSTAQTGWICYSTGDFTVAAASLPSIGNADSNATTRNNADTSALFVALYNEYDGTGSKPELVLQDDAGATVARGADAATDFAADRRLVLPDILGRTLGVAGTSGDTSNAPTARSTGDSVGEEAHANTADENGPHNHGVVANVYAGGTPSTTDIVSGQNVYANGSQVALGSSGNGDAHNTMQPTFFVNVHVKL